MIKMVKLSEKEFEEYLRKLGVEKLGFHGEELLKKMLEIDGFYIFEDDHDLYDFFLDDLKATFDIDDDDDSILDYITIESWINIHIFSEQIEILKVDFPSEPRFIYVVVDHGQIMDDDLKELEKVVSND